MAARAEWRGGGGAGAPPPGPPGAASAGASGSDVDVRSFLSCFFKYVEIFIDSPRDGERI